MKTLFDRVWDAHVVRELADGVALLYVDLHLVHEVTSPQAFAGLRREGRKVRRPERTLATVDHSVPTSDRSLPIADPVAARQVDALSTNVREFGVELFDLGSAGRGLLHLLGPGLGRAQPPTAIALRGSTPPPPAPLGAIAMEHCTTEVVNLPLN